MKTLIVYYSLTGHTEQLAKELAAPFNADVERIRDVGMDRGSLWGYLCSAWQAASGATPPIQHISRNPADYDLVVIGTPIWNWRLAAPVRTFATTYANQFKDVAFFCTEGGSGDRRAFDELQRICGKPPRAVMAVKAPELDPPRHARPLKRFVARLAA